MLRKRSIFLFIVLIALMGVTLVLTNIEEKNQGIYDDEKAFAIEDILEIDKVVMEGADEKNELVKDKGIWRVQHKYEADPAMAKVLLQALNEVRIKRPAPNNLTRRIFSELNKKGTHVKVYKGDKLISSFLAGGDMEKRESYFLNTENGEPMIVYIPGYDSYVSGIFELKESDWRNRVIFQSNWTSLQNVKIKYPDENYNDFEINFKDSFFYMPELEQVDTAKMMAYIELYNYVEAENYITKEKFPNLDSLLQSKPFVVIEVNDMNPKKDNTLQLYKPIHHDQTLLGIVGNGQLAVIKYPKVQNLIKKRADFLKN
ncbi:MAG: DUF4340 domain-containing protein [Bacteroidota bacterium]|nr:DUF4340 domain-containing protein [Bacteroidota bacterium]